MRPQEASDYYQNVIKLSHRYDTFDDAKEALRRAEAALRDAGFDVEDSAQTTSEGKLIPSGPFESNEAG